MIRSRFNIGNIQSGCDWLLLNLSGGHWSSCGVRYRTSGWKDCPGPAAKLVKLKSNRYDIIIFQHSLVQKRIGEWFNNKKTWVFGKKSQ